MIKSALQSSLTNDVKYRSMSAGAVPSNEYLIQTIEVGATPLASITFDNLSQWSGIYRHLQIVFSAVAPDGNGFNQTGFIRFNGDSATNYSHHSLYTTDGPVGSGGAGNTAGIEWWLTNNNSVPNAFGAGLIDVLDAFNTSKNKTVRMFDGAMQTSTVYRYHVALRSGAWRNTAAVSSIQVGVSTGTMATNCRFSLYGVTA